MLRSQTSAAIIRFAVPDRLAAQRRTNALAQEKLVAVLMSVFRVKNAAVQRAFSPMNRTVATTKHVPKANVAVMVHVQIFLESCVVDCPSVLEVHVVGKIMQQNAARVVRHAADTTHLLYVVIVENTVKMGNV